VFLEVDYAVDNPDGLFLLGLFCGFFGEIDSRPFSKLKNAHFTLEKSFPGKPVSKALIPEKSP